jgi:hypothetical protein
MKIFFSTLQGQQSTPYLKRACVLNVLISFILRTTITVTTMFRYIVQSEILEVYIFQVAAFLHLFEYVKKHLIDIQKFYFPISLQRQHTLL